MYKVNYDRYGLEGNESMIPAIDAIFQISSKMGISEAGFFLNAILFKYFF